MKVIRGVANAKEALSSRRMADLDKASPQVQARIREVFGEALAPSQVAQRILQEVRARGDEAVKDYTQRIDGIALDGLEVPRSEVVSAWENIPEELGKALKAAHQRIEAFHRASMPKSWMNHEQGYGERVIPMERVGVYVPGGTASYPSTVLMTVTPARVAGVGEVILATPPAKDGEINPAVLVAADISGADRVFRVGGAQAIGAMAYGTAAIPQVDIICGPGNAFVTLAKKMVYGEVGIDGLYGPTETVIIADDSANAALCAADLLAQAEHDWLASPILITTSEEIARDTQKEIKAQVASLERGEIASASLSQQGCIVIVGALTEAVEVANYFAPEHLCIATQDPWALAEAVKHAGGLFLGEQSPEVMGDYAAGPSHVMPTGGTARFNSPVGVHTFIKRSAIVALPSSSFDDLEWIASSIARAEGLTGHARAAERRRKPSSVTGE